MNFSYLSSSATHIGKVRRRNEDAFLEKSEQGLWLIADGMGGHDAGGYASQLIVETIDGLKLSNDVDSLTEEVRKALYSVNDLLIELGDKYERLNGSTTVAMMAEGSTCNYVWAGDSRLYRLRDNKLTQITRDHTQAEIYVDLGMLTRAEASQHISANLLTRCIGIDVDLKLESGTLELSHGDRFLLSSDGLDKHVSLLQIESAVNQYALDDALNKLISMALDAGGTDNITITIVDIINQ